MPTSAGEIHVIGRLSAIKVLSVLGFFALVAAVVGPGLVNDLSVGNALLLVGLAVLGLLSLRLAYLVLFRGAAGLYVRDGVLFDALARRSARLENINSAYRESTRGFLKTELVIEIDGAKPANRAYPRIFAGTLGGGAMLYATPIPVMLERLEACGVKIGGSKTDLVGL